MANPINAVVVTRWPGEAYPPGHEKVFLTSLPVGEPLEVLDRYDLRSLIENTAFRELKQGWCLESYPKRTEDAVRGHVFLTLVPFTLANAFRSRDGQALASYGIRRQRADEQIGKVMILAGDFSAIFDIEEVLVILGVEPRWCFRTNPKKVRHRFGLSSAA